MVSKKSKVVVVVGPVPALGEPVAVRQKNLLALTFHPEIVKVRCLTHAYSLTFSVYSFSPLFPPISP
jgi:glutamine amidotransferase PdxT